MMGHTQYGFSLAEINSIHMYVHTHTNIKYYILLNDFDLYSCMWRTWVEYYHENEIKVDERST